MSSTASFGPGSPNPPRPPGAPDDESLSAWLDDELPAARRESVEAGLRADPAAAARARMWAADRDALVVRYSGVIDEPVPPRLAQLVLDSAPRVVDASRVWRLAAAVAIFALGFGTGGGVAWHIFGQADGQAQAQASSGWVHRAAIAHAVFAPETRHPVEVAVGPAGTADNRALEAHLAGWLTRRLDLPVKLFDLSAEGYELVGGRLLPDASGPSAQLMYERRPGLATGGVSTAGDARTRVTVYLRKPRNDQPVTDGDAARFSFERQGELNTFYWVEGATGYALVGAVPREQLLTLAEAIYRQGR